MYLKSLEIQGFKSFPDKTKLNFTRGLTSVVGPNGSGKSNISDAVRWVMGEQSSKTLRGAKMEDVIFGGTQTRKSMGFAQVSITIDNSQKKIDIDSEDITISRRYYRSGESEYQVNGQNVRLKDIHEMFMDTGLGRDGYSIIGQGKIGEIVSAKSNERREIFEEAAGISKFRYRKEEAQRRLDMAEENMLRLRDIITELEDRIGPLKEQSEKAKKFLELADEKKRLEVSLWTKTIEKLTTTLRDLEYKIVYFNTTDEDLDKGLLDVEANIDETFKKVQDLAVLIDEKKSFKRDNAEQLLGKDSQIAVLHNDIHHNEENIERINIEINQIQTGAVDIGNEISKREIDISEKSAIVASLEQKTNEAVSELENLNSKRESYNDDLVNKNQSLSNMSIEIARVVVGIETAKLTILETEQKLLLMTENSSGRDVLINDYKVEQKNCEEVLINCNEQISSLSNSIAGYEKKFEARQKKHEEIISELTSVTSKISEKRQRASLLESLEKNMEGFAQSVKVVMQKSSAGALKGIKGPVLKLINAGEKYSIAIETALGAAVQNIVVENEADAKAAIYMLKSENIGRATFLPLSNIQGKTLNEVGLENCFGYLGIASELIEFDDKYKQVINSLLGRIVVCDDLDSASAMAKKYGYRFRIVTLDGQVINSGGSFTGGANVKSSGMLSRTNDIEKLIKEADALTLKSEEIIKLKNESSEEISKLNALVTGVRSELLTHSEEKIRFESEQRRLSHALEEAIKASDELKLEIENSTKRLENTKLNLENDLTRQVELQANIRETEELVAKLSEDQGNIREKRASLTQIISTLRLEIVSIIKEIEGINFAIEDLKLRHGTQGDRVSELNLQITGLEAKDTEIKDNIVLIEQEKISLADNIKTIDEEINQIITLRNETEQSISVLRAEEKKINEERSKAGMELARLEERKLSLQSEYDTIIEQLWKEYEMTPAMAQELSEPIEDISKTQKRVNDIRARIRSLGSVNVDAIDEYVEVSQRYEFLTKQVQDVDKAKMEISKLINDLTITMREMFSVSFENINKNFGEIFVSLFGGGKAELRLTDNEDILECGIDISVTPPGKYIKNLSALSGGEQAFVAIAIYFAILKVNPAPFCMLDEIEAALDDVNVSKYANYLRSMNDKTQFIMITHRRGTMEESDVLYGVTMQEKGVSKLLEIQVSEIEQHLGIKGVN